MSAEPVAVTTKPRSLEKWANHCHLQAHWIAWSAGQGGADRIVCLDCARTYAEQEKAAAELGGKVLQEWYENCQRERDALLAVTRQLVVAWRYL